MYIEICTYTEIVPKHSKSINGGLRDTVVNNSGEYNAKQNEICSALTT